MNGNLEEEKIKSAIEEFESKVGGEESEKEDINLNILDLVKVCSEFILNFEFLLGGGEFFIIAIIIILVIILNVEVFLDEFLSSKFNGFFFMGMIVDFMLKVESSFDMVNFRKRFSFIFFYTLFFFFDNREG